MKHSFKSFTSKLLCILFLSGPTTQSVKPSAIAGSIAAVELGLVAAEVATAISYALSIYTQSVIHQQEGLPFDAPTIAGVQVINIPLEEKTNEEVVSVIAHEITTAIGTKYGLSPSEKIQLWDTVQLQHAEHVRSLCQIKSTAFSQAHNRFQSITDSLQQSNRLKSAQLTEKAISDFFEATARAHHPNNKTNTQKIFKGITNLFIDCNSANIARRIEARIWLSHVSHCDPYVFGYTIKEAALNLQERYFDHNNNLIDLSYDAHLPETIKMFLQDSPYFYDTEYLEEQLHEYVQEKKLDPGDAFEMMRLRDATGGVSAWDKLWGRNKSYKKSKVSRPFFLFRHGDRRKEIFDNPNNHRLYAVASLAEHGDFQAATKLAQAHIDHQAIKICRKKLCNQYGILKQYQHLPTWQNLPLQEKEHIAKYVHLQDCINCELQKESLTPTKDIVSFALPDDSQSNNITAPKVHSPPMPDKDPDDDEEDSSAHNAAQYEKLKKDLAKEEITSVTGTTKHGLQRFIERKFSGEEIKSILESPDMIKTQADGAKIFIKKLGESGLGNEKYSVIIKNTITDKVITSMKDISKKALENLIKNYK